MAQENKMINPFLQEEQERFEKEFGPDSELNKFLVFKYGAHIHHGKVVEVMKDFLAAHDQRLLDKIAGEGVKILGMKVERGDLWIALPRSAEKFKELAVINLEDLLTPPKVAEIKELEK